MSELVRRLSYAEHPVEVTLRPARTLDALKDCIDRGYVHIKFTDTKGGTELSVRLDAHDKNLGAAALNVNSGPIRLAGTLTLDYVKVRCIADIDPSTLAGKGRLEPITD